MAGGEIQERFRTGVGAPHSIVFFCEKFFQHIADIYIIIYDQNCFQDGYLRIRICIVTVYFRQKEGKIQEGSKIIQKEINVYKWMNRGYILDKMWIKEVGI